MQLLTGHILLQKIVLKHYDLQCVIQSGSDVVPLLLDGHAKIHDVALGKTLACSLFQFRDGVVRVERTSELFVTGEVMCTVYILTQ